MCRAPHWKGTLVTLCLLFMDDMSFMFVFGGPSGLCSLIVPIIVMEMKLILPSVSVDTSLLSISDLIARVDSSLLSITVPTISLIDDFGGD